MLDIKLKEQNLIRKNKAFTLAEVLITIGIIGIVAALTIPTLMQKNQDATTVAKLKKVYSMLSNAYNLAVQENGTPDTWGLSGAAYSGAPSQVMMQAIIPYLHIAKDCGLNANQGCWTNGYKYLTLAGTIDMDASTNNYKVRLADGIALTSTYDGNGCNNVVGPTPALSTECGAYEVDVNGDKGPNQVGVDYFRFYLTKYGILPKGVPNQTSDQMFSNRCVGGANSGFGCAAWVVYNENLDYLRCPASLSWAGAHTCP